MTTKFVIESRVVPITAAAVFLTLPEIDTTNHITAKTMSEHFYFGSHSVRSVVISSSCRL